MINDDDAMTSLSDPFFSAAELLVFFSKAGESLSEFEKKRKEKVVFIFSSLWTVTEFDFLTLFAFVFKGTCLEWNHH